MASALCGEHLAKVAESLGYRVETLASPINPAQFPYQVKDPEQFDLLRKEYDRAVKRGHPIAGVRTHRVFFSGPGRKIRKKEWQVLFHTAFKLGGNGMDPDCDCEKCWFAVRRPLNTSTERKE